METTTETRWIRDADGSYTEYADLDEFYDAMFEHGVTVPGPEGYVEDDDGRIVVSWGRSYRDG